jgi:structural maintenance of chromosome 4
MKDEHKKLECRRNEELMNGLKIISQKLKEIYCFITQGGDAELEALDANDPFSEGIIFLVRPPNSSWK